MRIPAYDKQTAMALEKQRPKKIQLSDRSASERRKYREKALRLFENGFGYVAVANKLKLSVHTVKDWFHLYRGGSFSADLKRPGRSPENFCTKDVKDEVRKEFTLGSSINYLSVKFGKSKSTIRYWIQHSEK